MRFDPFAFERRDVDGVPVFFRRVPWVDGHAAIRVAFRAGGRHDPAGREGLAHFFEHMPFDGCEGAPNHDAIEAVRYGLFMGTLNAFTSMEYTVFTGRARLARLGEAFDFFRRLIWQPLLEPSELERERQVITREIWRAYDNPKDLELARLRWADSIPASHPFSRHWRCLGFPDTVGALTREELLAFHAERYVRENMAIFVVGDGTIDDVAAHAAALVAAVPRGVAVPALAQVSEPLTPPTPRRDLSYGEFFGVSGDAVPKNTEIEWSRIVPRAIAHEATLHLASGVAARVLYDEIRGRFGATYHVGGYASSYRDFVEVGLHTKTDPERADDIAAHAEEAIGRVAAADPAYVGKFEEVKAAALDRAEAAEYHTGRIADDAATDWAVDGDVCPVAEKIEAVRGTSYGDVAKIVGATLQPADCQRYVLRP